MATITEVLFCLLLALLSATTAKTENTTSTSVEASCIPGYEWSFSSTDESPCQLASDVLGACGNGHWTVPPLNETYHYMPPNQTNAGPCICSRAAYNLLSACTACQGFNFSIINWDVYVIACTNFSIDRYFPENIALPDKTVLPIYAQKNPSTWNNGIFNVLQAQELAVSIHSSSKSTKLVIGIVIACTAVVIFIGLFLFLLCRRRFKGSATSTRSARPGHMRSQSETPLMTHYMRAPLSEFGPGKSLQLQEPIWTPPLKEYNTSRHPPQIFSMLPNLRQAPTRPLRRGSIHKPKLVKHVDPDVSQNTFYLA